MVNKEKMVLKIKSLLETTQNTRDLGGYLTNNGTFTKYYSVIRSDVQNNPSEKDIAFLKEYGITTIIDLRGKRDVERKPSGFENLEGFKYNNFPVEEGSGVPESTDAVPVSYLAIAKAASMADVFKCIAHANSGVMFNCTAGKDRTGVVSAILMLHAGVSDSDIIENYVLTKEYGKEQLELVHKNFPEIDMKIVTPCEEYMQKFLELFRTEFISTKNYFKKLGLSEYEDELLIKRMVGVNA